MRMNLSNQTFDDYNWAALVLPPVIVWGLLGNVLVCIAISTEKRLQNVTNYFLLSLAVVDLLVSVLVMPISILIELHKGRWYGGFGLCLFHTCSDVILCTASIVHLTVISIDRYLGISNPLKRRNQNGFVVVFKIGIVWLVALIISSPVATLAIIDPRNIFDGGSCQIRNPYFMIYGSTLAFLVPLVIMLVTYIRTSQLLKQQAITCQDSPGGGLRRTMTRKRSRNIGENSTLRDDAAAEETLLDESTSAGGGRKKYSVVSESASPPRKKSVITTRRSPLKHRKASSVSSMGSHGCPHVAALLNMHVRQTRDCSEIDQVMAEESKADLLEDIRLKVKERTQTLVSFARKTAAQEVASELKATRVLGVVFVCFFVCWAPFFALNFTMAFCGTACVNVPQLLSSCFLWLGYISSTLNPLIYTIFNHKFRRTFSRLLRCQPAAAEESRRAKASTFSNGGDYGRNSVLIVRKMSTQQQHCRTSLRPESPISDSARASSRNSCCDPNELPRQ